MLPDDLFWIGQFIGHEMASVAIIYGHNVRIMTHLEPHCAKQ